MHSQHASIKLYKTVLYSKAALYNKKKKKNCGDGVDDDSYFNL